MFVDGRLVVQQLIGTLFVTRTVLYKSLWYCYVWQIMIDRFWLADGDWQMMIDRWWLTDDDNDGLSCKTLQFAFVKRQNGHVCFKEYSECTVMIVFVQRSFSFSYSQLCVCNESSLLPRFGCKSVVVNCSPLPFGFESQAGHFFREQRRHVMILSKLLSMCLRV